MTLLAEVKALLDPIEDLAAVYRAGWTPEGAALPYATILDPISNGVALQGDARTLARRRLLQVDIWQERASEDDDLIDQAVAALDSTPVPSGGRLRVLDSVLVQDEGDPDVVHHALTISIART